MWEENPRELFQGKLTQSGRDWKPNPHNALGMIRTRVLEVEGKERYHYMYANPTSHDYHSKCANFLAARYSLYSISCDRRFLRATGGRSLSAKPRDEDIKDEYPGEVTIHPETNKPTYVWDCIKNKSSTVCRVVQPLDPSTPKPEDTVRFVCISDTHNQASRILPNIPDGDVLIHAGDFTNIGSLKEIKRFNDFLGKLPHRHKIVIAGNHEVTFDRQLMTEQNSHVFMSFATALEEVKQEDWKHIPSLLTNCTYLEDAEVNIMGFRIYGSPW